MDNKENSKKKSNIVAYILLIIIIVAIGFVVYDKFVKKDTKPVETSTDNSGTNTNNGTTVSNTITSIKRVIITEENQIVSIGGNEYKIRKEITVDGAFLLINDKLRELGDDGETAFAETAYVTNKYIFFTVAAQDEEFIVYAIDKDANAIKLYVNDYEVHNFVIADGNLNASGHIFCDVGSTCEDIDLVIKYDNNAITIMPKE